MSMTATRRYAMRPASQGPAVEQALTFGEYAEGWLARQRVLAEGGLIRISTMGRYRSALRAHLLPFFAARRFEEITRARVDAFRMAALNVGRLNRGSVNGVIDVLRLIVRSAQRDGLIDRDPLTGIRSLPIARRLVDPYLADEIDRLIEATRPAERVVIGLAALAGLRRGEVLAIRPSDIDFQGRQLRVVRSLQRHEPGFTVTQRLGPPKSAAGFREVPLQARLGDLVTIHIDRYWRSNPYDLLCSKTDGEPLTPVILQNEVFAPAIKRAGLRPLHFHDLRRSFVVHCVRAGVPVVQTAAWLGHSIAMTEYYYRSGHGQLLESLDLLEAERSR